MFPQLAHVEPERIAICVNGIVNKERKHVRIGPMAWAAVVPTLARFEVLDIFVKPAESAKTPQIVVNGINAVDVDALPNYEDVKEKCGATDFLSPSRAPSPYMKQLSLDEIRAASRPSSRSPSHSQSRSSPSSTRESSPSITDWAKSLFGKRVE